MDRCESAPTHIPVMLQETLADLAPTPGGRYLDGTVGLGGHAFAILSAYPDIELCGLDQDNEALELAKIRLACFGDRVHLFHLQYGDFPNALKTLGWTHLNGALLDLGVSSLQLDKPERGFSFRQSGPLDMRMDQASGRKNAWHLINRASHAELRECLATLGEDPQAGRIARHIIEERQKAPIDDTARLAEIIFKAYPPAWRKSSRRHPATRAFQALRMAVNGELEQLEHFLNIIPDWLEPDGRLVIISFHSLEDRLVKRAMRAWSQGKYANHSEGEFGKAQIVHKKPLQPADDEIKANPRASSAKLRAALWQNGIYDDKQQDR